MAWIDARDDRVPVIGMLIIGGTPAVVVQHVEGVRIGTGDRVRVQVDALVVCGVAEEAVGQQVECCRFGAGDRSAYVVGGLTVPGEVLTCVGVREAQDRKVGRIVGDDAAVV